MKKERLNVAFMGTGRIARKVAETVSRMTDMKLYAAGSRSYENAESFASEYGFCKSYGSYESLLEDDNIDLVYIATPHSVHLQNMKMCIDYGRNILCEKSFTLNAKQARDVFDYAKNKNLYIGEAIWCRYSPMAGEIRSFIESGELGNICHVNASLGYPVWFKDRVRSLELGGGALLDVGVYCLNFIDLVMGLDFKDVHADAFIDEQCGTDRREAVTLVYDGGRTASFYSSVTDFSDRHGGVFGEKGCLTVDNVNNYESFSFYSADSREKEKSVVSPSCITGYEYQFSEAKRCIEDGLTESPLAPHSRTVAVMEAMDRIRKAMGVSYPQD